MKCLVLHGRVCFNGNCYDVDRVFNITKEQFTKARFFELVNSKCLEVLEDEDIIDNGKGKTTSDGRKKSRRQRTTYKN